MAAGKIRVLIVDDFADTRESITKLLYFEKDIEVVGSAADAQQGIRLAKELRPDVILMDINMPGMDGIAATEVISSTIPASEVIMMSVQGEPDYLRRAMLAGAREYLVKPFGGDELSNSIRQVYELAADKRARLSAAMQPAAPTPVAAAELPPAGRMISVFSPKGGVGRTTVAANLAIALRLLSGKRVALVDCSLLFGDVGIILNLPPNKTISDLIPKIHALDVDMLESVLVEHQSGTRVLLAPSRPELAELVTAEHLRTILTLLKTYFDYVVVDTRPSFEDTMLTALDLSEKILVLTTLEMPAIKNIKLFLEVAQALQYTPDKLVLVLNRADSTGGIRVEDIEASIDFKVTANLVSAGHLMTTAANNGVPVVMSHRDSPIGKNLFELAARVLSEEDAALAKGKIAPHAVAARDSKGVLQLGKLRLPSLSRRGVD